MFVKDTVRNWRSAHRRVLAQWHWRAQVVVSGFLATASAGCAVSTQREVEMGETYSAQINRQLKLVTDGEVTRYINLLGDSIARVADNRSLDWHFFVVDSREVNAFAVPGGFVYVNRGLIERTERLNQLAGVLAHEIGHVTQRHSVKQMQAAQRANTGLTLACILTSVCDYGITNVAVQVGGGALFAKFSRDDETEADRAGIGYLVKAHIDPRGVPEMFRILLSGPVVSRTAALQQAEASVRTTPGHAHPYFWAPFVVVGDHTMH